MIKTDVIFEHKTFVLNKNGHKAAVMRKDNFVIVYTTDKIIDSTPFVMLVHQCADDSEAYKKQMYIVGKLCKKDVSSKYFRNHKLEEHLINGNYEVEKSEIVSIVLENNRVVG